MSIHANSMLTYAKSAINLKKQGLVIAFLAKPNKNPVSIITHRICRRQKYPFHLFYIQLTVPVTLTLVSTVLI